MAEGFIGGELLFSEKAVVVRRRKSVGPTRRDDNVGTLIAPMLHETISLDFHFESLIRTNTKSLQ